MPDKIRHSGLLALDQTIMRLEEGWFTPHGDDTGFDAHPLPIAEFLAGMFVCGDPGSFIDVGCGMGTKLSIAHFLGWDVSGIERHADYAEAAQKLCPEANVSVGDAWDCDLYEFDVVYSYRLMVDLDEQHRLSQSIVNRMKPGALYFCPGSDPKGLEHLGSSIWRVD